MLLACFAPVLRSSSSQVPRPAVTVISGRVVDAVTGHPVRGATVKVTGVRGYTPGFFTGNDGRFQLDGVPPGTYLAVAVAALPLGSWKDRSVLEKLQSSAETIRVGEGQRLTISIRASPTPEGLGARADRLEHMVVALRTAASQVRAMPRR